MAQVSEKSVRSKVLVLSAHSVQLDRRIVAQANALVQTGREVVILSVPTLIPEGCLDSRIRVIVPSEQTPHLPASEPRRSTRIIWVLRALRLVRPLKWVLKPLRDMMPWVTERYWTQFFLDAVPREPFDVIHCHDLQTLPAACKIADSISPAPKLIYDSHELFPYQFDSLVRQLYWKRVERRHIKHADLVITVNESIAERLRSGYSIKKPEVIYNSFDSDMSREAIDESEFLRHFGAEADGIRVIFQGGFSMDRNLESTVLAFGILPDSIKLFLLGAGPAERTLRKLCREQRIGNVFFGQWVPQADLLAFLGHAHIGLIPYTGDSLLNNLYCTPNKLFEFMEAGLPICASDLVELRRIVKGLGIGDVYQMATAEQIAAAVKDLAVRWKKDEFEAASFGAAREKFGWTRQREKLLGLYEDLGI